MSPHMSSNMSSRFNFSGAASRIVAAALCTLAAGSSVASVAHAQQRVPTGLGSVHGNLLITEPKGEFGRNTGNGYGLGAGLLLRVEPNAILNWRTDVSVATYGSNTRRIPLAGTGGLIQLDLRTTSSIFSMVTGPQLLGPTTGRIMPYANLLGGFSVFWTESSVEGSRNDNEPFASTTNNSDFVWAYGGSAGLNVRVYEGNNPVSLDFGARLLRHDNAGYLNSQRVKEAFENDRPPVPIRSRADFVTYYAGVSVVVF